MIIHNKRVGEGPRPSIATAENESLATEQSHLAMSHWHARTSDEVLETTLGDLLRHAAATVPDRCALVEGVGDVKKQRRWTYGELLRDCEQVGRGLLSRFAPGERVVVYAANSPEWVILQHSMSIAGLILVPINPAYTLREALHVINDAAATGLFYDAEHRGRDLGRVVADIKHSQPLNLRHYIPITKLRDLIAEGNPAVEFPPVKPYDTVQIQYTSGTTGTPKGALLHHLGVINTARNIALRARFPDGGVHINAMPMFHIAGAHVTETGVIAMRGTFVLMPYFDAKLMLQLFESERGHATLIVPTMMLGILDHPDFANYDISSLQTIFTGASNVPSALVRRTQDAMNCQICIIFGQTETNGPVTLTSPGDNLDDQTQTVGQPLPNVEVKIVDIDTFATVSHDTIGEIWVRGYQTTKGYHNLPDKSQEVIRADGWLRTGDLGTMDRRGYITITGRLKEVIIRGGMNFYPKEIEDVLFDHPEIDQVAVLGVPDEKWGEIVAAVVLAKEPSRPPTIDQLKAFCADRIALQKTPALWYFLEEYPMTSSGKIQKNVLKEWILSSRLIAT